MYFQDIILALQRFWAERGCLIVQPYNSEVGAGTYNPATFLRALGPEPWNVAFVEPSRRPSDGRYGENPNRTAAVSPVPGDPQAEPARHPGPLPRVAARARHRAARSTTCASSRTTGSRRRSAPGASAGRCGSTGWRSASSPTSSRSAASTAGRSRASSPTASSASRCTCRTSTACYDLAYGDRASRYGEISSAPSGSGRRTTSRRPTWPRTSRRSTTTRRRPSGSFRPADDPMKTSSCFPAYDFVVKAAHQFNVLDARGAIGVTERQRFIGRVRGSPARVAESYLAQREALGFPLLKGGAARHVSGGVRLSQGGASHEDVRISSHPGCVASCGGGAEDRLPLSTAARQLRRQSRSAAKSRAYLRRHRSRRRHLRQRSRRPRVPQRAEAPDLQARGRHRLRRARRADKPSPDKIGYTGRVAHTPAPRTAKPR